MAAEGGGSTSRGLGGEDLERKRLRPRPSRPSFFESFSFSLVDDFEVVRSKGTGDDTAGSMEGARDDGVRSTSGAWRAAFAIGFACECPRDGKLPEGYAEPGALPGY